MNLREARKMCAKADSTSRKANDPGEKTGRSRAECTGIFDHKAREWQVEQGFEHAVRAKIANPESTFYEEIRYMVFHKNVFRSVESGNTVYLPLFE